MKFCKLNDALQTFKNIDCIEVSVKRTHDLTVELVVWLTFYFLLDFLFERTTSETVNKQEQIVDCLRKKGP